MSKQMKNTDFIQRDDRQGGKCQIWRKTVNNLWLRGSALL